MPPKKPTVDRPAPSTDAQPPHFESSLAAVERIVARLESGELGLTESLEQYEQGIQQLKHCHALLAAAEQKVSLLSGFDADGNPITAPLDELQPRSGSGRTKREKSVDDDEALF